MKTKTVTIVTSELDWCALYLDDLSIHQNHSLHAGELARILIDAGAVTFAEPLHVYDEAGWVEDEGGSFPQSLAELKEKEGLK